MEYRQIVAVTGMPGLYQLVSTKNDGAFVRSLADKSIKFVSSRVHQLTPLESIEIYTYGDNVRLHEVLENIKGNEAPLSELLANKKVSGEALKQYFATVLPDFDQDRVYASDIKKVLKWYELLKQNDLLHFDMYKAAPAEAVADAASEEATEEAPKKTAKKAAKKEEVEGEEKPAKKAAKKAAKVTAEGEEKPAKKAAKKAAKKDDATAEEKPAKKTAKKKED
jgi:hypothetical protein